MPRSPSERILNSIVHHHRTFCCGHLFYLFVREEEALLARAAAFLPNIMFEQENITFRL
jgi:hypothetical protein